jgi:hypothetical protein
MNPVNRLVGQAPRIAYRGGPVCSATNMPDIFPGLAERCSQKNSICLTPRPASVAANLKNSCGELAYAMSDGGSREKSRRSCQAFAGAAKQGACDGQRCGNPYFGARAEPGGTGLHSTSEASPWIVASCCDSTVGLQPSKQCAPKDLSKTFTAGNPSTLTLSPLPRPPSSLPARGPL